MAPDAQGDELVLFHPDGTYQLGYVPPPDPGEQHTMQGVAQAVERLVGWTHVSVLEFQNGTGRHVLLWDAQAGEKQLPINRQVANEMRERVADMPEIRGPAVLFRHKFWKDQ